MTTPHDSYAIQNHPLRRAVGHGVRRSSAERPRSPRWSGRLSAVLFAALFAACASPQGGGLDTSNVDAGDTWSGTDTSDVVDGNNQPPILDRIGNRRAPIGKLLQITLAANDPDGDALSYSVFGDLPDGSKFSKETRTLEWTPQAADDGKLIILTFAVSDGVDEDRETIQITVTATDEQTAPVLAPIGDVFVPVGAPYELRLQATDEDGDKLTFSTAGPLPAGAALEAKSGVLTWTPSADQQGMTFRVTFVVSDGTQTAEADARFLVQTPELSLPTMRPVTVKLNETLDYPLPIENPQAYPVTCTASNLAPGATFDAATCTLSYKPTDATLAGTSIDFGFRVQASGNGVDYNLVGSLTVFIVEGGTPANCQPDSHEPNNTQAAAPTLRPGTQSALTICGDDDWFRVEPGAGAALRVDLAFTHRAGGDLDLHIFAPGGQTPVAQGDSATSNETAVVANTVAGAYLIRVFEVAGGQNTYDLTLSFAGDSCTNDAAHEPNDSFASASSLGAGNAHNVDDGMLCPGEVDMFAFDVTAGNSVELVLAFDNAQGDLDLELYDPQQALLGASRSTSDEERIALASAPAAGSYYAVVYGYQNGSAAYLLEITQSSGVACAADSYEPNNDPAAAKVIPAGSPSLSLTYCGDSDYFKMPLGAGETAQIDLTWTAAGGAAQLYLLDPTGSVVLRAATPRPGGGLRIEYPGDTIARDYLLEISDATLALSYTLQFTRSTAGCDALSCPAYTVCGDSGQCLSDFCLSDADCPTAYRCRQTFCVDACYVDDDCRTALDYACRALAATDVVAFCAPYASGQTGDGCSSMEDCAATLACLDGTRFPGGMCAVIGCGSDSDCDASSTCVSLAGTPVCLPFCLAASDCRSGEGYTCQALPSVGVAGDAEVCIK